MNVDTGALVNLKQGEPVPKGYKLVPPKHSEEARDILGGNETAQADMEEETPLVKWAKSQQKKPSKNLKAMQKKSKRINRGK